MISKRIDKNLEDLVVNLKLTKPSFNFTINQQQTTGVSNKPVNAMEDNYKSIEKEQSIIDDNFNDFNCYSFYQLKQAQQQNQKQQFSFCNQFQKNLKFSKISNRYDQDSLSRFSSIVDQLKTQGDQVQDNCSYRPLQSTNQNQNINHSKLNEQIKQKNKNKYSFQIKKKCKQKLHAQYFSDSLLKQHKKTYKSISKNTTQLNLKKQLNNPIYAKLNLLEKNTFSRQKYSFSKQKYNNSKKDLTLAFAMNKQNNSAYDNKNMKGLINLEPSSTSKKVKTIAQILDEYKQCNKQNIHKNSNYTSNKKMPFTTGKSQGSNLNDSHKKEKIKHLNDKIRKQNNIVYESENKLKDSSVSPLSSFKKSKIQPHKFSTYKLKLFA